MLSKSSNLLSCTPYDIILIYKFKTLWKIKFRLYTTDINWTYFNVLSVFTELSSASCKNFVVYFSSSCVVSFGSISCSLSLLNSLQRECSLYFLFVSLFLSLCPMVILQLFSLCFLKHSVHLPLTRSHIYLILELLL